MAENKVANSPKSNNSEDFETEATVSPFPVSVIDTSWMTNAQKVFYEVLRYPENRDKGPTKLCELAGFKSRGSWYKAIEDEKYAAFLINMGLIAHVRHRSKPNYSHYEVNYIRNSKEREDYLKQDEWDMRRLFENYPKHFSPNLFIVKFTNIENIYLRKIVKRYFINMLGTWEPSTFKNKIKHISDFLIVLNSKFPNLKSFKEIDRQEHIEKILPMIQSFSSKNKTNYTLISTRAMFQYMYTNKWSDGPKTDALIISYDMLKMDETLPRPIPPHIKIKLDDYIENTIIPLLEDGENTPIVEPKYWDLIIILRHTGRRFEDMAHLISDGSDIDCLKYDLDGDPQLFLDHRIAKFKKDLVVPLAHIKDSEGRNIVERAVLRQKNRVKDLPPTSDNKKYLFREIISSDTQNNLITETLNYNHFKWLLPKICNQVPLTNIGRESGDIYNISPHQFRHTVATEMIDAGVDIYAVKNFLGHSSVAMTEKYIKVYQYRLKKEFKDKLLKSDASAIKDNLPEQEEIFGDNKWVKNKIIAIFDQGDGCCEHPYKMPSCPHQVACKTCIKKKILPRHKNAVVDTIGAFSTHLEQAKQIGLEEKIEEFDKVVNFYQTALEIIDKGEMFDAAKHFYTGAVH